MSGVQRAFVLVGTLCAVLACAAEPRVMPAATIRVYVDTGRSMVSGQDVLARVAEALPAHLSTLIEGNEDWLPLPPNTRIMVDAFCTVDGQAKVESRLTFRVGDSTKTSFRSLKNFERVQLWRDHNSDLDLMFQRHAWPLDLQNENTIVIFISNSTRPLKVPEEMQRAMEERRCRVIRMDLPAAGELTDERLTVEVEKRFQELVRSIRANFPSHALSCTVSWSVVPADGVRRLVVGQPKTLVLSVTNNMGRPIPYLACKVREIVGLRPEYLLEGGELHDLAEQSIRELRFTITVRTTPSSSSNMRVVFYLATLAPLAIRTTPTVQEMQFEVEAPPRPVARFRASSIAGPAPLTVRFDNESENAVGFLWDFGDGTTNVQPSPVHTFAQSGVYDVRLLASGPGGSDTATQRISVDPPLVPPIARFQPVPSQGRAPLRVNMENLSLHADRWLWDFGDGRQSEEKSPAIVYEKAGTYTVRLLAIGRGGTNHATAEIVVSSPPPPPVAKFRPVPAMGDLPLDVQFENQSENADEWLWDFGDGTTSTARSPNHVYKADGKFTVVLTAKGPGGEDTARGEVMVIMPGIPSKPAKADFTIRSPIRVGEPLRIENRSIDAASFEWSLNPPVVPNRNERTPLNMKISRPGQYTLTLKAWNNPDRMGAPSVKTVAFQVEGSGGLGWAVIILVIGGGLVATIVHLGGRRPAIWIGCSKGQETVGKPVVVRRPVRLSDVFPALQSDLKVECVRDKQTKDLLVRFSAGRKACTITRKADGATTAIETGRRSEFLPLGTYEVKEGDEVFELTVESER